MRLRCRRMSVSYLESQERTASLFRRPWEQPAAQPAALEALWHPPIDVYETADGLVVKAELAGMDEADMEVLLYPDALVITGHREDAAPHRADLIYHEAGIRYGPFRCDVYLPLAVDGERVEASYNRGFLTIMLPRAATSEGR
ncbi:MAG: Hsp20/alpha crystallin family protein [Chloroflexi bacterium]|nr:Hsp20/alpha crystallin family protein [Chloroflexota bacterium]